MIIQLLSESTNNAQIEYKYHVKLHSCLDSWLFYNVIQQEHYKTCPKPLLYLLCFPCLITNDYKMKQLGKKKKTYEMFEEPS